MVTNLAGDIRYSGTSFHVMMSGKLAWADEWRLLGALSSDATTRCSHFEGVSKTIQKSTNEFGRSMYAK